MKVINIYTNKSPNRFLNGGGSVLYVSLETEEEKKLINFWIKENMKLSLKASSLMCNESIEFNGCLLTGVEYSGYENPNQVEISFDYARFL